MGKSVAMSVAEILLRRGQRRILAWHHSNETSRRLDRIPGLGPVVATARLGARLPRENRISLVDELRFQLFEVPFVTARDNLR